MENINIGINEQIITGRKYRRLIDKAAKLWQRISWWTKASDVEFDDGKTAEQKVGNINGITSDLSDNRDDIAASIASVNVIDGKFGGLRFGRDEDGKPGIIEIGEDGADTVVPFTKNNILSAIPSFCIVTSSLITALSNAYVIISVSGAKKISFKWNKGWYTHAYVEVIDSAGESLKILDQRLGEKENQFFEYILNSNYETLKFHNEALGQAAGKFEVFDVIIS